MVRWIAAVVLLLSSAVLYADERKYDSFADTTYLASQVLIVGDWLTTRDCSGKIIKIDGHYEKCQEVNPITRRIVGRDIDKNKLDLLMLGLLFGNHMLNYNLGLSDGARGIFNTVHMVVRWQAVEGNLELGLEIKL